MAMGQKDANPNGHHRFWSIFPFTNRVFKVPFFDPQPYQMILDVFFLMLFVLFLLVICFFELEFRSVCCFQVSYLFHFDVFSVLSGFCFGFLVFFFLFSWFLLIFVYWLVFCLMAFGALGTTRLRPGPCRLGVLLLLHVRLGHMRLGGGVYIVKTQLLLIPQCKLLGSTSTKTRLACTHILLSV